MTDIPETGHDAKDDSSWSSAFAFAAGVLVAFGVGYFMETNDDDLHADNPVHNEIESEVHVHSDFIVYLDEDRLDLSADKYMSASNQVLHQSMHLHDNIDTLLHRHAEGVTVAEFFASLGFELTDDCFVTDSGVEYCTDEAKELALYVNGEPFEKPSEYINQDENRFLLYYGQPKDPIVQELLADITDEACIYSGTCPERGVPPPESCGLTCEI